MTTNNNEEYEYEDDNDSEFNSAGGGWTPDDNDQDDNYDIDPIENQYFTAYYNIKDDPNDALNTFLELIKLINSDNNNNNDKDNYKFKSFIQVIILSFNLKMDNNQIINYHKSFLKTTINIKANDLRDAVQLILNTIKSNNNLYNIILDITMQYFNDKKIKIYSNLWFDLGIEHCHHLLDDKSLTKCKNLINILHDYLKINGNNDKNTSKLLQVYAVKIKLNMILIEDLVDNNYNFDEHNVLIMYLRCLINETKDLISRINITDNHSMSIIYSCLGIISAHDSKWNDAYLYFKDSFVLYSNIAHKDTTKCLKYLLISYMICSSEYDQQNIVPNPYDMNECDVYKHHNDIINMTNIVNAFENDDINQFNKLLKRSYSYETDKFYNKYIHLIQLRLQGKSLINLIKSYDRVKLQWLSSKLDMTLNNVEKLIVNLINDNAINGRLDQVNMILILKEKENRQNVFINSLNNWLKTVNNLQNKITNRSNIKQSYKFGAGYDNDDDDNGIDDFYIMDNNSFFDWQ